MSEATPWYHGNEPGGPKAMVGDADRMGKVIGRAKRILVVTGPRIGSDGGALYGVAKVVPKTDFVASPSTRPTISTEIGFEPDAYMNVLEVMDRLRDPYWKGFDGKGRYDLVILMGMDYYYESQMFSLMKHFGHGVKAMSLDRRYQPNASYSFGNLARETWERELHGLAESMGGGS